MIAYIFPKYPENFALQPNYLLFYCNLPLKFAIFLKISYFLTVSIVFSVYKQNFTAKWYKN